MQRLALFVTRGLLLLCSGGIVAAEENGVIDFAHDVVPILRRHCVECHGGTEAKGGMSLNTRETLLDASVASPSDAGGSRLIELVSSSNPEEQMPPKERERLNDAQVAVLKKWIDAGMPWEAGFTFDDTRYEPPLRPREVELPPVFNGRTNPVDRLLDAYRTERGLPPLQPIDDAAFMRRLSLDVMGRLPEPDDLREFLDDGSPEKRERMIHRLLDDDRAYAEHWLTFWSDLLRNTYAGTGFIDDGRRQITEWLYGSLFTNKPYDQFVRELIAPHPDAAGFIRGIKWRGNVNSSQATEIQFAQSLGQALLGINLKCASCHDSFIDRWTLDETYNLAAVYATTPLEVHRCDVPSGRFARPAWIFPELGQIDPAAEQPQRLQQLAEIMTHPENGRLTRTIVNRLWHRFLGRGIVHPVDAMQTRPWSEDLLDFLAWDLQEHSYDLKHTIALIAGSEAYQSEVAELASAAPAEEGFVFTGPLAKRMTAEQFVDAIHGLAETWPGPDGVAFRRDGRGQGGQLAAVVSAEERAAGKVHLQDLLSETMIRAVLDQSPWVWKDTEALTAPPKAAMHLRKTFSAPTADRVVVVLAVDGSASVFLNGRRLAEHQGFAKLMAAEGTHRLQDEENLLAIRVENDGKEANPAALLVTVCGLSADGEPLWTMPADETWRASAEGAGGWELAGFDDSGWSAVKVVGDAASEPWKLAQEFNAQKLVVQHDWDALWGDRPVRASLAPQDALQATLGRPNREQIVTSRPSELTTLEAISLSNGEDIARMLRVSAEQVLAQSQERPAFDIAEWLYMAALSRPPNPEEAAIATEVLGSPMTREGVADLLWTVVMLPEFQLIR